MRLDLFPVSFFVRKRVQGTREQVSNGGCVSESGAGNLQTSSPFKSKTSGSHKDRVYLQIGPCLLSKAVSIWKLDLIYSQVPLPFKNWLPTRQAAPTHHNENKLAQVLASLLILISCFYHWLCHMFLGLALVIHTQTLWLWLGRCQPTLPIFEWSLIAADPHFWGLIMACSSLSHTPGGWLWVACHPSHPSRVQASRNSSSSQSAAEDF